jgi:RNA recognition motif-containing protein
MTRQKDYRIYVSNLHFDATPDDLFDHFEAYGTGVVDAYIPKDRNYTTRYKNRGFGFVEFDTERERDDAIEYLDGKPGPGNRALSLRVAEDRTPSWMNDDQD